MAKKKKASTDHASTSGVKRVKYVAAGDADEDVFEQVPNLARSKKAEAAPAEECEEAVVIADQRRICPRVLVKALKGLNDLQIRLFISSDSISPPSPSPTPPPLKVGPYA